VKTQTQRRNVLGVLGGMGPLASAEFLKTIYEHSLGEREQDSPVVMLYSDPTFPDRTEALASKTTDALLARLVEALEKLRGFGVSKIVICCVTIHHLLPQLPEDLRKQVVSLTDVIFARVVRSRSRHLLVCTSGARGSGIFEGHPSWARAEEFFVLPDDRDQAAIHRLIYQIKKNSDVGGLAPVLEALLLKYGVESFVAGCTETHLLAKCFRRSAGGARFGCVDPLDILARELAGRGEHEESL
jgi:aspartate racemase